MPPAYRFGVLRTWSQGARRPAGGRVIRRSRPAWYARPRGGRPCARSFGHQMRFGFHRPGNSAPQGSDRGGEPEKRNHGRLCSVARDPPPRAEYSGGSDRPILDRRDPQSQRGRKESRPEIAPARVGAFRGGSGKKSIGLGPDPGGGGNDLPKRFHASKWRKEMKGHFKKNLQKRILDWARRRYITRGTATRPLRRQTRHSSRDEAEKFVRGGAVLLWCVAVYGSPVWERPQSRSRNVVIETNFATTNKGAGPVLPFGRRVTSSRTRKHQGAQAHSMPISSFYFDRRGYDGPQRR